MESTPPEQLLHIKKTKKTKKPVIQVKKKVGSFFDYNKPSTLPTCAGCNPSKDKSKRIW